MRLFKPSFIFTMCASIACIIVMLSRPAQGIDQSTYDAQTNEELQQDIEIENMDLPLTEYLATLNQKEQSKEIRTSKSVAVSRGSLDRSRIVETSRSGDKYVPQRTGSVHTMMGWQMVTAVKSDQYKLRSEFGQNYDKNGFAKIGDLFVVATKPFYGVVGDCIEVYKSNGDVIKCIIGDIKGSDGGGDTYQHKDGSVVEFIVDRNRWYATHNGIGRNLKVSEFYPQWERSHILKIVNIGNVWNK